MSECSPKKRKTNEKCGDVVVVGVRKESKSHHERRVPIVPEAMAELMSSSSSTTASGGSNSKAIRFCIQPAEGQRVIPAEEFCKIGVEVNPSLDHCDFIIGIKEIPKEEIQEGAVYCFFSHVIKAQPYNMPMLKSLMAHGCTLIDYEKMTNDKGQRVVAFGHQAGQAGMINGLHSLGQRLRHAYPAQPNPFATLKQAAVYGTSAAAKADLAQVGREVVDPAGGGLPAALVPMVVVVTGKGNVAGGVFDILHALESSGCLQTWSPAEALANIAAKRYDCHHIYLVVLDAGDLYERKGGKKEEQQDFTFAKFNAEPQEYESTVSRYLPHATLLVNAVFWRPEWPRYVTKAGLKSLWKQQTAATPSDMKCKTTRLLVIADITCDIEGSVETTVRSTMPDSPSYVYHPETEATADGFAGDGVVVMAVDILPTELPLEASRAFCAQLKPYLREMVTTDYRRAADWGSFVGASGEGRDLTNVIKNAIILYRGKLTPNYAYLQKHVE